MEPERKIEKLLRAFAKKRSDVSGEPLKLHPATRHMLQAEVARRAKEIDTEESSISLWRLFRDNWAFLVGYAMLIFFFATIALPNLSSAKKKAQSVTAMNNLKQVGMAARLAADENNGNLPASLNSLTNAFLSDKVLTDPQNGKPFVYVAANQNLDNLPSNAVLAYSPEDASRHAILFADGRVELADSKQFSELTNQKQQLTLASRRIEAEKSEAGNTFARATDGVAQYTMTNAIVLNGAVTAAAIPPEPTSSPIAQPPAQAEQFMNASKSAVLQNFQWQQNGSQIVVRDNDGSIYNGSMVPQNQNKDLGVEKAAFQSVENNSFRVAGMNQTLKQNVVFDGNLVSVSNIAVAGGGKIGGNLNREFQSSANQLQSLLNFRIIGTATIANTNKVEINANPQ